MTSNPSPEAVLSPPPQDLAAFLSSLEPRIVGAGATGYVVVHHTIYQWAETFDAMAACYLENNRELIPLDDIGGICPHPPSCTPGFLWGEWERKGIIGSATLRHGPMGASRSQIFCSSPEQFFADVLRARAAHPSLPSTEPLRECDKKEKGAAK